MFEDTLPYKEYNRVNKDNARLMRKTPTQAEDFIWARVLRKKQTWYLFLRQKMIGSFILDFYCSKLLVGIEIDGSSHNNKQEYDIEREERMRHHWVKIIRFTNEDVLFHIDEVIQNLHKELQERKIEIEN